MKASTSSKQGPKLPENRITTTSSESFAKFLNKNPCNDSPASSAPLWSPSLIRSYESYLKQLDKSLLGPIWGNRLSLRILCSLQIWTGFLLAIGEPVLVSPVWITLAHPLKQGACQTNSKVHKTHCFQSRSSLRNSKPLLTSNYFQLLLELYNPSWVLKVGHVASHPIQPVPAPSVHSAFSPTKVSWAVSWNTVSKLI